MHDDIFRQDSEMDPMPNRVCQNCFERMTQFYVFRQECLQSNDALQKYLNRTPLESNEHSNEIIYTIADVKPEVDALAGPSTGDFEECYDDFNCAITTYNVPKARAKTKNGVQKNSLEMDLVIECYFGTGKGDEIFKCITCNATMNNVREMYSHMAVHQPVRNDRKCPHCNRQFHAVAPLRRHLAVHSSKFRFGFGSFSEDRYSSFFFLFFYFSVARPFKCSICYRTYKRIDDLQSHFRIH